MATSQRPDCRGSESSSRPHGPLAPSRVIEADFACAFDTTRSRGSCLDDPRIDIPLRTGFNGSLPCRCKKYSGWVQITNCDDSG